MAIKKTTNKKTTKPTAKKAAPKAKASPKAKPQAKKSVTSKKSNAAKPQSSAQALKSLAILPTIKSQGKDTRRKPPNDPLSEDNITIIATAFNAIRDILADAAANIRVLDRKRMNGVGIKKQGFIERAYDSAAVNENFLPSYLTLEEFRQSFQYFINLRTLFEACNQLREFIWNLTIQAADITYTDSLEYYAAIREAAQRRIDGAESIFRDLSPFFKRMGTHNGNGEQPETKKQTEREVKGLLSGKRDGKIVIENISPKLSGGVHKVIDEKFTDRANYKETEEGEIKE